MDTVFVDAAGAIDGGNAPLPAVPPEFGGVIGGEIPPMPDGAAEGATVFGTNGTALDDGA